MSTDAHGMRSAEAFAEAVVESRLGAPPRDVLEAAIVLEAWAGRPARRAISSASALVDPSLSPPVVNGHIDLLDDREQTNVLAEGLALVLSIVSIAAWASPLSKHFGLHTFAEAIKFSLPITVALQWALRSRYLSRKQAFGCLASDWMVLAAIALAIETPLVLIGHWGPIAAVLVPIWTCGTIITRRGWGLLYAGALVGASIAFNDHLPIDPAMGVLTGFTVLVCLAAILTRRHTSERPGSVSRALTAAVLGGLIGLLLVEDPSLGWGVHGLHPAIALIPSIIGSFWGGYHLWNLYEEVPKGMSGVSLAGAARAGLRGPAMRLFLGAVARLIGATVVLTSLVIFLGNWTKGTDKPMVFVAFGAMALVSLMVSLLESLSLTRAALVSAAVSLGVELCWHYLVHSHVPGAGLAIAAAVGVLVTLPPLIARLTRSGRVLATYMWIQ
jgi:hypothetical protein